MKKFSMKLSEKAEVVLKRAEELAKSNGVQFQNNGKEGSFAHLGVKGTFKIRVNLVEVEYTKPVFISDSMVQHQIKQVLGII
jgi:hypothetical protein